MSDQDLLDYITGKPFEELSKEEKVIVLNKMSEEEYKLQRETHLLIQKTIYKEQKEVRPSSEVKTLLLKRFREKHKKENQIFQALHSLLNYKIPLYQPALILALVFIYLFIVQVNRKDTFESRNIPIANFSESNSSSSHKVTSQDNMTDFIVDTVKQLSAKETPYAVTEQKATTLAQEKDLSISIFDASEAKVSSMTLSDDSLLAVFFTSIK